ncbi:hypothetical protein Daus18300_008198 [Diaporthe australafricana]|uniref:Peptide hydrolase n=1 Tax=Diaporthe australafricana TaxID=127596 RepID=A0ABR3WJ99_9PEZI
MQPFTSLGVVLVAALLPLAFAEDGQPVDPETLRGLIDEAELVVKAETIQAFAYGFPERNRLIGTPALDLSMQLIWDTLDEFDYFDLSRQDFEANWELGPTPAYNIIAQTKGGDPDNVLQVGAHMDSVQQGPGMNDNASGGIGLFEIAIQLAENNFTVNNAVRFSWWSAEEEGLIGSTFYVDSLSEEELQKTRLYLNFDMIASSSQDISVYSSDFSKSGMPRPPGVEEAEQLFQDYFDNVADLDWESIALRASSDHWPFVEALIPTGGLHSGNDPYYHTANDTVENMSPKTFFDMTKAIAHAVGTYADSFDSLPPRELVEDQEV